MGSMFVKKLLRHESIFPKAASNMLEVKIYRENLKIWSIFEEKSLHMGIFSPKMTLRNRFVFSLHQYTPDQTKSEYPQDTH